MKHTIEVDAKTAWQNTGIKCRANQKIKIVANHDSKWTANPATGKYGAAGINIVAKPYYCLPGAHEGALVGNFMGEHHSHPFSVSTHYEGQVPFDCELHLSINDDVPGHYGAGFKDNEGFMKVEIELL